MKYYYTPLEYDYQWVVLSVDLHGCGETGTLRHCW